MRAQLDAKDSLIRASDSNLRAALSDQVRVIECRPDRGRGVR